MQLFYYPHAQQDSFFFDKEESGHIIRVLRKQEGDTLHVTDGRGSLHECDITLANPKRVEVIVQGSEPQPSMPYNLTLAIAPTKNRDRLEWLVEKATEIGIGSIIPVICDHSERQIQKTDRLKKIAIAAMKQSLRFHLPLISEAQKLDTFLSESRHEQKFMAHLSEPKRYLHSSLKKEGKILVLVGPEGDFSKRELELAAASGFTTVALGDYRLRTETAGMVAVQSVAQRFLSQ